MFISKFYNLEGASFSQCARASIHSRLVAIETRLKQNETRIAMQYIQLIQLRNACLLLYSFKD